MTILHGPASYLQALWFDMGKRYNVQGLERVLSNMPTLTRDAIFITWLAIWIPGPAQFKEAKG